MKKIVLGAVLVLFITVGIGVYYLLSNLDTLVKAAIETYGSEATQTAVRVESVKIGLKDGSGAIRGLTVANPKGFAAEQAFSLGEISTAIDLDSLSGEVIVIEHFTVLTPEVYFELNADGKSNLDALKKNVSSGSSSSASASNKESSSEEPKLIIRKVLFAEGNIHARVVPLDKDYELKLPKVEMHNLGGKNGATPTQISEQILKRLTDQALAEIKKKGIDQYREKLEGEVNKRIDAETQKLNEKVGEGVGDKLKGVLNY